MKLTRGGWVKLISKDCSDSILEEGEGNWSNVSDGEIKVPFIVRKIY